MISDKEPTDYPIHMRRNEPDKEIMAAYQIVAYGLFALIGMVVGFILALIIT
jgi:hypothetical protein